MERRILTAIILALLIVLSKACVKSVEESVPVSRTVTVRVSCQSEKSSLGLDEDRVEDLNLYVYQDGLLIESSYSRSGMAELDLVSGHTYRFYALANTGRIETPDTENDISSVSVSVGVNSSKALPMATRNPVEFCPVADDEIFHIQLQRLFCKVRLKVDKQMLSFCEYSITSAVLRQVASTVSPFAMDSYASQTKDGDCASYDDVQVLNSEGVICFFAPENCQGVLLPDNEDPMEKVLEDEPQEGLCTYLEVNGKWKTSGAKADLMFRMYLGEDNHSDFNVRGNKVLDVELKLTDEATIMSNWKISSSDCEDERILRFVENDITMNAASGEVSVPIEVYPPGLKYSVRSDGSDLSSLGLTYSVKDSKLNMSTTYVGDKDAMAFLRLSTWDEAVSDYLSVYLEGASDLFDKFELERPMYPYQFGSLFFPEAEQNPVKFSVGETVWWVGKNEEYDSYSDPSGWRFELIPSESRIYISCESFNQKSASIEMYSNGSRTSMTIPPTTLPEYTSSPLTLSEGGNSHFDSENKLWYDQEENICLAGSEGQKLKLSGFAVPDAVLAGRGLAICDRNRFAQLLAGYSDKLVVNAQKSVMWYDKLDPVDIGYEMCYDDALCRLYFYGTAQTGGKKVKTTYSVTNSQYPSSFETGTNEVVIKPAFPAQRYLGEVTNMTLAHSWMKSSTTDIKFDKAGVYSPYSDYPQGSIEWDVLHAGFEELDIPSQVTGEHDSYVEGVSFEGNTFHFSDPTETVSPCCGGMLLKGRTVNPHTGIETTGAYTVDVILYLTVGASVDFIASDVQGQGKIAYSFVPFNKFGLKKYSKIWKTCLPSFISVSPNDGSGQFQLYPPATASENSCFLYGNFSSPPVSDIKEATSQLDKVKSKFCFDFCLAGEKRSSLDIKRGSLLKYPALVGYDDGRAGYYKIRRHYSEWPGEYVLQLKLASFENP